MKEQFVTYEVALKLKELNFDEPCCARYNKGKFENNKLGNWYKHNSGEIEKHYISAPLYQQVLQWLREKHKIFIQIEVDQTLEPKFVYSIFKYIKTESYTEWLTDLAYSNHYETTSKYSDLYYTYEEALEDGIINSFEFII